MKNKKLDIEEKDKSMEASKVVELAHKRKETVHNLVLLIGAWHKLFNPSIRNILVSLALNHCVRKDGLIIHGYWIAQRNIYLIVKCQRYSIEHTLEKFAKRLDKEIRRYLKHKYNSCSRLKKKNEQLRKKYHWKRHFEKCILWNDNLIKMLTGQKVNPRYHSPSIAKMKDLIENFNYCSALDYTKAKGPVIVKLLKRKEHLTNQGK